MPRTVIHVDAPPDRVFAVLAEPQQYARWVVGVKDVRDADAAWPAIGTRLHHSVGFGPLGIRDHTQVLDVEAPRRLRLLSRAGPLGAARVSLLVAPQDGGSRVTLVEEPADLISRCATLNPVAHPLVQLRNASSLRRLKELAEQRR